MQATGPGWAILQGKVPAESGQCAATGSAAIGFQLGNANQAYGPLQKHGYVKRPPGDVQVGDAITWQRFGNNPKSAGFRYGHFGFAAVKDGVMGYISNFTGSRVWRPMEGDYRAWAPPKAPEVITREGRMAPAGSGRSAPPGPSRAKARAVLSAAPAKWGNQKPAIRGATKKYTPFTSPSVPLVLTAKGRKAYAAKHPKPPKPIPAILTPWKTNTRRRK